MWFCGWSLSCYVIIALLEWKLGVLFSLWVMLRNGYERFRAPRIQVPLPSLEPISDKADPSFTPASAGPGKIQCFDKGTYKPLGVAKAFSKDEVAAAVSRARVAQKRWAETSFSQRRTLLFSLLNYVVENQKFICETSSVECGKTLMDGALGEILTTLEKLRWTAYRGEEVLAEEVRDVSLMTIHKRASVTYVPFGVIGAIVSWNYPFHNIWGPMISALFAGNGFIGKVSEHAAHFAKYYESIVREGLQQLGQDPQLVTFVTGFADAGEAVVEKCDKVTFIGSPGVGKLVMKKASETLTPVVLELGGKDPAVVLDDADLDQVVPIVMRATFQNCGQNCVGVERVVAQKGIHDKLVDRLVPLVRALSQGPASVAPVKDLGAMTMGKAAVSKIQKLVDESVAAGAKVLVGGKATSDNFFPATIIVNVKADTPIALEEVFGPILVVMKFDTDEEAINLINACPYGLGSNIFAGDVARAERMAARLQTGMVNINDFAINYLCQSLPFGGTKISGFDRFAGVEGLRGNCLVRAKTKDRIPGVKTMVPPILQYPISDKSFDFMATLATLMYGNVVQFFTSAFKLATFKK